MNKVIREVLKRQKKTGLSDRQFSKKLGFSHCTWEAILKGKRNPGYKVWGCIMQTYPDLAESCLDVMQAKLIEAGKMK